MPLHVVAETVGERRCVAGIRPDSTRATPEGIRTDVDEINKLVLQGKGAVAYFQPAWQQRFDRWWQAANEGVPAGQWLVGACYTLGTGVSQDYAEAVKWYRKAAEQGNACAQNSLGESYALGQGVPQDYHEAAIWYRKAAEQGNALAESRLGRVLRRWLGRRSGLRRSREVVSRSGGTG